MDSFSGEVLIRPHKEMRNTLCMIGKVCRRFSNMSPLGGGALVSPALREEGSLDR